jgi:hypothetical protein
MGDRVSRELWLAAAAEEVWDVVTADGWLAESVSLELWPGGEAEFRDGDRTRQGWVEEALAPRDNNGEGRLAFWWAADDEPASRVEISLEDDRGRTRVRVVEARPLEILDLVGLPLARPDGRPYGPALVA